MECEAPTSCEPIPTGYQRHEIRDYQRELAEPGIRGENYIFVAPTGSGKTLVTAIIIAEHLKKLQAYQVVLPKWFLGPHKATSRSTMFSSAIVCPWGSGGMHCGGQYRHNKRCTDPM